MDGWIDRYLTVHAYILHTSTKRMIDAGMVEEARRVLISFCNP